MDLIKTIEESQKRPGAQEFNVGDTVKVYFKIVEGRTERIQVFEGIVLCKKNEGARQTFTVRKISYGVGVERVFPYNSPRIVKVEVVRPGKVRRAKLYYLRDKIGKDAKVKTLVGAKITAAMEARNARAEAAAAATEAKIKEERAEAAAEAKKED
ncbi:50S ribosomal protein L19 [Treponema sp. Marseille-Q3903]|uniref:50S ribosomal protein L19 n=1 Tax=Treponema sp. Marseille-Q3903 TaxID=2766703 RepID=UPI00165299D9|nr:50S ribosomal protein L19 [Treponema sp. Marseille-Q3903]MBC6713319.1 50S ribosomal protein L19 [Treponema sp. Marseille-Q3903]